MSLWAERFHFASGKELESFNTNINDSIHIYRTCKWIEKPGDDENNFIMVNLENVDCIEFERVEE